MSAWDEVRSAVVRDAAHEVMRVLREHPTTRQHVRGLHPMDERALEDALVETIDAEVPKQIGGDE